VSFTIQITNSVNKTIIVASDLLRVSSGYIRGSLQIDGSNVETEYMYLQGTTNNWTTITGIYTANNLSVGTHTISLYADFTTGAGAWDGPTYVQATVWDGPSV
jgi:hypothetical protein